MGANNRIKLVVDCEDIRCCHMIVLLHHLNALILLLVLLHLLDGLLVLPLGLSHINLLNIDNLHVHVFDYVHLAHQLFDSQLNDLLAVASGPSNVADDSVGFTGQPIPVDSSVIGLLSQWSWCGLRLLLDIFGWNLPRNHLGLDGAILEENAVPVRPLDGIVAGFEATPTRYAAVAETHHDGHECGEEDWYQPVEVQLEILEHLV